MPMTGHKSLLHQMAMTTPTDFWNDSCSIPELTYALENGAVGATTNPVIVYNVLKKELPQWKDRVYEIIRADLCATEVDITWRIVEALAIHAAKMLIPIYEREQGLKGRISIQTNPQFYRNPASIVEQGEHFQTLYQNLQIKIPVTQAGIVAAEELTYRGVHITATVCFTVSQALAIGEAVERGLARRAAEGKPVEHMNPVCAIMIGRTDDWMQVVAKRDGIAIDPGYLHWAGIAVFKRAYQIFQKRGYRTRLLAAAMRHIMHWSELIGADASITIPYEWQLFYNNSNVEVRDRIQTPVSEHMIQAMSDRIPDFRRAYEPGGLEISEFDTYGATARTLRSFMASYFDLTALIRDFMLPNPDKK
jgi:transaldolase